MLYSNLILRGGEQHAFSGFFNSYFSTWAKAFKIKLWMVKMHPYIYRAELQRLPECLGWLCLEFLGLFFVCNCEFASCCWSAFKKSTTSQTDPGKGRNCSILGNTSRRRMPLPDFCHFWYATKTFRPVKSAPRRNVCTYVVFSLPYPLRHLSEVIWYSAEESSAASQEYTFKSSLEYTFKSSPGYTVNWIHFQLILEYTFKSSPGYTVNWIHFQLILEYTFKSSPGYTVNWIHFQLFSRIHF